MAQLVERVLGKDEVSSSNLDSSSKDRTAHGYGLLLCIDIFISKKYKTAEKYIYFFAVLFYN